MLKQIKRLIIALQLGIYEGMLDMTTFTEKEQRNLMEV
jgi:hypothetical protein